VHTVGALQEGRHRTRAAIRSSHTACSAASRSAVGEPATVASSLAVHLRSSTTKALQWTNLPLSADTHRSKHAQVPCGLHPWPARGADANTSQAGSMRPALLRASRRLGRGSGTCAAGSWRRPRRRC
jgi:hypothetical protein